MKAVVYDRYGPPDVLRIAEVERPVPKADEILVAVRAVAVTRADVATRAANHNSGPLIEGISRLVFGVRRPRRRILGSEVAGVVDQVGTRVKAFAVGDAVFGSAGFRFGGWAEYVAIRERGRIARKPAAASFVQAAPVCDGGIYALWLLRQAHLKVGDQVLIYGASGAIGSAGVQLAKSFGARVTAVTSTGNLDLVKSIGADELIDYTSEDFTHSGRRYDAIFDAVGKLSFARCRASLKPRGRFLATDGLGNFGWGLITLVAGHKKVKFSMASMDQRKAAEYLAELVATGQFRPLIDRTYRLEDVVQANRYVDSERKLGNVVLTLNGS